MLGFNYSLGFFSFSKYKEKRNFAALKIIFSSIFVLTSSALFGLAYVNAAGLASNTLPTNGQVVSGQAAITQSGNVMNINQSTQSAVINWSSFNVGSSATVNFNQPNVNASTLNRVNGGSKSMIDGALNSNGQIIFVNPNGVIFGKGAEVNTGGITATTMDIRDSDYMNGKMSYSGNGTGRVVNKGNITVNSISGYIVSLQGHAGLKADDPEFDTAWDSREVASVGPAK
jgi:filamentous hemagglutinin family protein